MPVTESSEVFEPTIHRPRRISSVWFIPFLALMLAGWLLWKNNVESGPLITVSFETAEGIYAGKTEVRCRSVPVGVVEGVTLTQELHTEVLVRLKPGYENLLRSDSLFWVVRPRLSSSSVSGLGTFLTGAYLELDPGTGSIGAKDYIGLENPPVTSSGISGLHLTLTSKDAGTLTIGSPIYYRGFEVGKLEQRTMDHSNGTFKFEIFIRKEYSSLVRKGSRFWNNSGFDVSISSEGFKFRTPTIQALLSGGISFSTPLDELKGAAAGDGDSFVLYDDQTAAEGSQFKSNKRALLLFDQSVRGLNRNASVEYRGIQVGRVVEVSFKHSPPNDLRVPVLIELDTNALQIGDQVAPLEKNQEPSLSELLKEGLRAKLANASLITGALYIDLDFSATTIASIPKEINNIEVIPTKTGGLALLEDKLSSILDKLDSLPIAGSLEKFDTAADATVDTLTDVRNSLATLQETMEEAKKILAQDDTQRLTTELNQTLVELRESLGSLGPSGAVQGDLRRTLDELRATLRSFSSLSDSIEEKPNSLLFGRKSGSDPIPRARR